VATDGDIGAAPLGVSVIVAPAAERAEVDRVAVAPVAVDMLNLEAVARAASSAGVSVAGEDGGPQPSPCSGAPCAALRFAVGGSVARPLELAARVDANDRHTTSTLGEGLTRRSLERD